MVSHRLYSMFAGLVLASSLGCYSDPTEARLGAGEGEGEGEGEAPSEGEGEGEGEGEAEDCAFGPINPDAPVGEQWVQVCPGEFLMGSPEDEVDLGRESDETQHRVDITRTFTLRATEVTQAEWKAVMEDAPSFFADCGDDCPVENVWLLDIFDFCNELSLREGLQVCYVAFGADVRWPRGLDCTGYRLPTEAEWEYAARAGTQTAWSCGANADCLDGIAWYGENSDDTTHQVGTKAANDWGLYDMYGNVWEWVWDRYSEDYSADGQVDPTGPEEGDLRVNRGGGWNRNTAWLRAAARLEYHPADRSGSLGFRLARSSP